MTVYQPLSGLHRPVVIDPGVANFPDLHLDIYCPPGGGVDPSAAADLCRKLGILFENQGAEVFTAVQDRRFQGADLAGDTAVLTARRPTTLSLEIRTRESRQIRYPWSYALAYATLTLAPATTELTFTQDVVIRDERGGLLVTDTFRGRIVRRAGAGVWLGNKFLDWVAREPEEELTGEVAAEDFSADLYRQLSQMVFNATMRASVLSLGLPEGDGR